MNPHTDKSASQREDTSWEQSMWWWCGAAMVAAIFFLKLVIPA